MQRPPSLKISEVFSSIQGEGLRQGNPTHFIRLAGCNLKCAFCDTRSAWTGGADLTLEEILQRVRALDRDAPADWVCLTGGEPLLQAVGPLIRKLRAEGFRIQVETNATLERPLRVDWWTVSPKPPRYAVRKGYLEKAREVKLVVTRDLDLPTVRRLRKRFPDRTPILLQPQSNKRWSMDRACQILRQAASSGLKNIRLAVQLHKIFRLQ